MWINMGAMRGKQMVGDIGEKTLSYCGIPQLMDMANGKLFDDINSSFIIGAEFMCQVVYLHHAKPSVIKERLPKVIKNKKGRRPTFFVGWGLGFPSNSYITSINVFIDASVLIPVSKKCVRVAKYPSFLSFLITFSIFGGEDPTWELTSWIS